MRKHRKISAYGVCRSDSGELLLVRPGQAPDPMAPWVLPGGAVHHGEHPGEALARTIAEQTGRRVLAHQVCNVVVDLDVDIQAHPPVVRHRDCLIYDVRLSGQSPEEAVATASEIGWLTPDQVIPAVVAPWVVRALAPQADPVEPVAVDRRQRFAAYGLVTDPVGQVLLSLIADGFPGAGLWHLPGGGTDFAESAAEGLLRELVEETDQRGRIVELLDVSHRHSQAVGPEGVPMDWHSVRVVYRVAVDGPRPARVTEGRGGSTAAAAWFAPQTALELALSDIARATIEAHLCVG